MEGLCCLLVYSSSTACVYADEQRVVSQVTRQLTVPMPTNDIVKKKKTSFCVATNPPPFSLLTDRISSPLSSIYTIAILFLHHDHCLIIHQYHSRSAALNLSFQRAPSIQRNDTGPIKQSNKKSSGQSRSAQETSTKTVSQQQQYIPLLLLRHPKSPSPHTCGSPSSSSWRTASCPSRQSPETSRTPPPPTPPAPLPPEPPRTPAAKPSPAQASPALERRCLTGVGEAEGVPEQESVPAGTSADFGSRGDGGRRTTPERRDIFHAGQGQGVGKGRTGVHTIFLHA